MTDKKNTEDRNLRPHILEDYVGQKNIVKTLSVFLDAVKKRGIASEHILFYGPPGIGKTTLSYIIAHELSGELKITSGAAIERSGDLAAILTNLKDKDILFIDEIHRLPKSVEEMLYPVIEEYALDIVIGKGPSARTVRLPVPKITIVGATTKLALLSAPLRDRFGLILRLDYYEEPEMIEIVRRSAKILDMPITDDAARQIAKRSRRTPRIANRILKRARDLFDVHKETIIDEDLAEKLFLMLELDEQGLGSVDLKYLHLIATKYQNQAVGVDTIALSMSEDRKTVEEFIEPYLLQLGFIKKTSRGRVVTPKGFKHLKIKYPSSSDQQELL